MLYYLDDNQKTVLRRIPETTLERIKWLEKDLECLLADNIESLVRTDQLFIIAQERPRQEQPDIMAVDRDGNLYLFEIKRWRGHEENLLQVLRYGQRYGRYEYDRLNNLFQSYLHRKGTTTDRKPLAAAHAEYFSRTNALEAGEFNQRQQFVIVTNGMDRATWEAIEYWKRHSLPIEALIYRVYIESNSGQTMIDFDPYGPQPTVPETTEEGLFVVNTNVTYEPEAYKDMLQGKAAAFYGRKHLIRGISLGSKICLYHTGVGVIAIGKTISEQLSEPCGEDVDEVYYVKCLFDHKCDPVSGRQFAVTAAEINEHFGTGHCFRQTVFGLPAEYDGFIRQRFAEKRKFC